VAYVDINLKSLIESITNNLANIDVSIGSVKPPTIKGEIDTVRRLFINLINNSIEAMEENGRLEISFSQENNYCITEIIDNGKGISKQDMKKLFTPFHTTKQRGTGLGLSIVKKTVDEHNGKIEIRSKKGKGTRVRVYLPIQPKMNNAIK
jgi:signal transduction histidine kinase